MVEHHSADYGKYSAACFTTIPASAPMRSPGRRRRSSTVRSCAATPSLRTPLSTSTRPSPVSSRAIPSPWRQRVDPRVALRRDGGALYRRSRHVHLLQRTARCCRRARVQGDLQRIAGDEFRHYKLFYSTMKRYRDIEGVSRLARVKVALGRLFESTDDELSYAYHSGTGEPDPNVRRRATPRVRGAHATALSARSRPAWGGHDPEGGRHQAAGAAGEIYRWADLACAQALCPASRAIQGERNGRNSAITAS